MNGRRRVLLALVLVPILAAGVVYGRDALKRPKNHGAGGYICPLTGEELPCPKCCPLKQGN